MTGEEARAFMHEWWGAVWHKGDIERVDRLVAEPYIQHTSGGDAVLSRKELKERLVQYQRVLHAPVTSIDAYTVDGDTLWQRATSRGVNLETGSATVVTWMLAQRFADGQLAEGWVATLHDIEWATEPAP